MLCLSQTTGYAIKALGCLDDPAPVSRFVSGIAERTGVPRAYLAKIVNLLARQGLIVAKRGQRGGIALARPARQISLLQIVEAVEGKAWLGPCLLALDDCGTARACPTHAFWLEVRERIQQKLGETTLAEVIAARRGLPPRREAAVPVVAGGGWAKGMRGRGRT
jgi:Rrf2 family protein